MRSRRCLVLAAALLLVLSMVPPAWARDSTRVVVVDHGGLFCAPRTLILRQVIIPAERCFKLAVFRQRHGAFLAFLDPAVAVPARRVDIVSPGGFVVRERILFLVPIETTEEIVTVVPVNNLLLVPVRVEDTGPRLTIFLTDFRGLFVRFSTRR